LSKAIVTVSPSAKLRPADWVKVELTPLVRLIELTPIVAERRSSAPTLMTATETAVAEVRFSDETTLRPEGELLLRRLTPLNYAASQMLSIVSTIALMSFWIAPRSTLAA
jgi:hypothetical protein